MLLSLTQGIAGLRAGVEMTGIGTLGALHRRLLAALAHRVALLAISVQEEHPFSARSALALTGASQALFRAFQASS